ncbi:Helicase associated domain protein [Puia sp. P3]|uniref:Helicase associated domain protein n=1 Tax=Puia sp. P3 TaxID=3423952 RepID=UPI003D67323D
MELYRHNKMAYRNATAMFQHSNMACVIQPMGTGKAVIIGKFIFDHPAHRHLVLAPASHIDLQVRKHAGNVDFDFRTYNGVQTSKQIEQLVVYDFIYLDEFHRIGAEVWGPMVWRIILMNPQAKVLGTTATHIRYLDGNRDMAAEVFKNNIASSISLPRAFVEGILYPPKYISAIYSISEEYNRVAEEIKDSAYQGKFQLLKELKDAVVDWEKSCGIDSILKKHLPKERRKIIVFCQNIKMMSTSFDILTPILREIFGDVLSLFISAYEKRSINDMALATFDMNEPLVKVLYTVNMVNEGLHGKDVSVVILLRETASANIWYQQIGRCFSVDQIEQPIIFDFVNNFRNVQQKMFKEDYEYELKEFKQIAPPITVEDVKVKEKVGIQFIDETQGIQDLFYAFGEKVEYWEIYYKKALEYYLKHGHLVVVLKDNPTLHYWIRNQREAKRTGTLSTKRIELLDNIGIDWDKSFETQWYNNFNKLKEAIWKKERVPEFLNTWLKRQRNYYSKGLLSDKYARLLGSIVYLDPYQVNLWNEKLKDVKEYLKDKGKFDLGSRNALMRDIRHGYRIGSIPKLVLDELLQLDFPFQVNLSWKETLDLLKKYMEEHGGCLPTVSTNMRLVKWIARQRTRYAGGDLKREYVDLLLPTGALGGIKKRMVFKLGRAFKSKDELIHHL